MNVIKKIDNIVKNISDTTSGGNTFFDRLDSQMKNPQNKDIIISLFNKIYSDFGTNFNLVISGGFGDLIMFMLKKDEIKCGGTILQVSGGLTSHFTDMNKIKKSKEVIIQKQTGDIDNKDFIFVDDSFYSGTTSVSIDHFLKKHSSRILKTYVIYDGNDTKSSDRVSLYRYYDWNRGSKRSIEELMSELEKYSDIPSDIFEQRIMQGQITSLIQLRREINDFKIKSGQKSFDIHKRVRESFRWLKRFENFSKN
jgi:hypoxanthine phosphoribosyltransferase